MTTDATHEAPLRRPEEGRLLGGVAAGLADHFDLDVTIVRLAIVLLALSGGAGLMLYIAAWLLIPAEGEDRSVLSDLVDSSRRAA